MPVITLHRYYNDKSLTLDPAHIQDTERFDENADAVFHPIDPQPYTLVKLFKGCTTSEGVGTAYVRETPEQIRKLTSTGPQR